MPTPSTQTLLRRAIRDLLQSIDGIGLLDLNRVDANDVALRIGTVGLLPDGTPKPYWAVQVGAFRDTPAGFGEADVRPVFRDYNVRLDGWRGFVGVNDYTDDWERLTEDVATRLQLGHRPVAQSVSGFMDWQNLGAPTVDVVTLGTNARAHHCLFQFDARVFLRVRR